MQITYVNVFVSDLARAVAFYESTLGFALEFSDDEHGYASLSAGAIRLGLALPGPDQAALIGGHRGIGIAVVDLKAEHARLSKAGVSFPMPPTKQPWGGFMALMADPDGNVFYLDEVAAAHT